MNRFTSRRQVLLALSATLSLSLLGGCAGLPDAAPSAAAPAAPAAQPAPRLVVFMVVDGLPMRQVLAYRDQLQPDGFRRFLDSGRWFSNAHYGHGYTVTAAGHSVMLSGAYPQRSGIIGNEWLDAQSGAPVYCTGDSDFEYIGNKTGPMSGTSPRKLRVETVGDVLRTRLPASKVIGISGKDRGAILPAGHLGQAYMYMGGSGEFASSSYYMAAHPAWVNAFNAAKPADTYFQQTWKPLLPEAAYARSVPDGQPWQYNGGNGNRLPAVIGAGQEQPGPRFYGDLLATPFADELTLKFARAAIEGEALGTDAPTDILSVSLSSHDYVNHAFGPESRLSQDHLLQLDRHLQAFFQYLDQRLGRDNYLLMLTADHGFADTPEWARTQGKDVGRINPTLTLAWLNTELALQFGEGRWVRGYSGSGLLFDEGLIQARGHRPAALYAAARALMLQVPGIAAVFTPDQLAGTDRTTPYLEAMRKSWHPEVSAPVQVVVKPGWLYGSRSAGSSHGTPHDYDTHVPLLTWGPRWVSAARVDRPVEIADIAPTLATLLNIPAPAQSQGRVLPLH